MSEELLRSDHVPQTEQPPETVEEPGGGEEGEGVEEVIPKDAAPVSISPLAVPLPHLSSSRYALKKRAGRRKKASLNPKQRAFAEERLALLKDFSPIPFSPGKALDFSSHEDLFHALGLWEFTHLDLGGELRRDLVAHLIAYYDPANRRSYVDGARISVSRVDLARAVGLRTKKEKANAFKGKDSIQSLVCGDGATTVLRSFMSNYILFGDMCILPTEVMEAIKFVKEGVAYKVDWASVMWALVEKELLDAPKTKTSFYASHLQRLIEHQHPALFSKKLETVLPPEPETEEEEEVSVTDAVIMAEIEINPADKLPLEEEDVDADNRKMRSLEDLVKVASERHNSDFGLTLGKSSMNGFDDCKVNEESQWFAEGRNEGFEQCMRPCGSKTFDNIDFENLTKPDEEEKQEVSFANDLTVKFSNMEMMTSSDHLEEMENANIRYAQQVNHLNSSSGMLLTACHNSHKDILLDHYATGSIYFANNGKRKIDEIVHEEGQFVHNHQLKVMRGCEPWGNLRPPSFDECIDKIHCELKRAKTLFSERDHEAVDMEMKMHYLNLSIEQKNQEIMSLKLEIEGQQNWQMAVRQYEAELCLVSQMMLGYKRALKETRSRFADYRKKHPHIEEPLYKDVPGEGGLVLSVREFEKYRLMQEENKRQELLGTLSNLQQISNKLEECEGCIKMHDAKLGKLVGEMKQLKEGFVRPSCSGI